MKKSTLKPHLELLSNTSRKIFADLRSVSANGILGGGTAIMLLLKQRISYDFDIFLKEPIKKRLLVNLQSTYEDKLHGPLVDTGDELSVTIKPAIKLSFIFFPFRPIHKVIATDSIPMYSLQDLASNKAYVIGRRGLWRDYVDLFFLIKAGLKFEKVIAESKIRFGGAFSEKLFLEQLTYFGDIGDFTIDFIGKKYQAQEIMSYFQKLTNKYFKI